MLPINPKRLTASRLDLAAHCLWWARTDTELPEDEPFAYTTAGKEFHAAAESWLSIGDNQPSRNFLLSEHTEDPKVVEMFNGWTENWGDQDITMQAVEVPYAYNVATGDVKILSPEWWKYKKGKKSERGPNDLVAKADLIGWRDGMLVIVDHKTGQRTGRAEDSRQLMLGGLCAARMYEQETVCVEYHYVDDVGNISVDSAVLTEMELGGLEAELRQFVKEPEAHPRPGTHCSELFCKANELSTCPVTRSNTEALVAPERLPKGILGDEDARAWILLLPAVKAATSKAESALKRYVGDRELDMGDGRTYSPKHCTRSGYEVAATSYTEYRLRGSVKK